jgi:hypothetical protein
MTGRLPCCVPFCRSTRGDRKGCPIVPGMEWLCSRHWALVPRRLKRLRSLAKRRHRDALDDLLWARCKRIAIEAAGGLA